MSGRIVATYVYTNDIGWPVLRKVRREPKDFEMQAARYRHNKLYWKRGRGMIDRWQPEWGPKALYNLPVLLDALRHREPVAVVEGERDSDVLAALKGVCATTGWQGLKFTDEQAEWFAGSRSDVNVFMDNDEPGHFAAWQKYTALRGVGVKKKRISIYKPSSPDHKDITDVAQVGLSMSAFDLMDPRAIEDAADAYGAARAAAYADYSTPNAKGD